MYLYVNELIAVFRNKNARVDVTAAVTILPIFFFILVEPLSLAY